MEIFVFRHHLGFNSIKVQLEPATANTASSCRCCRFNSIKVQLEQEKLPKVSYNPAMFQFHKGSIRTYGTLNVWEDFTSFNSIKVQLEQHTDRRTYGDYSSFNSIKVQLERHCVYVCDSKEKGFNSIKVQLERLLTEP